MLVLTRNVLCRGQGTSGARHRGDSVGVTGGEKGQGGSADRVGVYKQALL